MSVLAVILARAGSKGLPDKCVLPICGRPMVAWTILHAQRSACLDAIVLSTDSERAAAVGREYGVYVVDRPPELADDTATVDSAVRHALEVYESEHDFHAEVVVILYGNIPVRADGIIDRCVQHLRMTGCDSVRTVCPVGKMHPDWMHRLDGDRLVPYRPNSIYRRQDLEPLYVHDAAVIAVTRGSLYTPPASEDDYHAFFGADRRAIVQEPEDTVDVDTLADFYHAEAILRIRSEADSAAPSSGPARHRSVLTGAVAFTHHARR